MSKHFPALGLLFSLSIATFAEIANACSCLPPPPPRTALEQSSAVFSGKVISLEPKPGLVRVTFEVYDRWKGISRAKIAVTTPEHSAACGINFEIGKEYLVYAAVNALRQLSADSCSRTNLLSEAGEDLQALGSSDSANTP